MNIENATVSIVIELDGKVYLVGMQKDNFEAVAILAKMATENLIDTDKTQAELLEFLGYKGGTPDMKKLVDFKALPKPNLKQAYSTLFALANGAWISKEDVQECVGVIEDNMNRFKEALEFYADTDTYNMHFQDFGEKARKTLEVDTND